MTSTTRPACAPAIAAFTALAFSSICLAHPDDPKERDVLPPYRGPGYRAAEGGVAGVAFPASGVTLRAWLTVQEFGDQMSWANDCWGYEFLDTNAPQLVIREYAIIGLSAGTGFVEITNPGSPQIVGVVQGPTSIWRDIKTYQQYAYAVSEAGQGIQVIGLGDIANANVQLLSTITEGGSTASHNVAIDEASGFLYRCGGNGNGLRIYDLSIPAFPSYVGAWSDRYVHDAEVVTFTEGPYAGKQIAFCCSGFNNGWVEPGIDVLDVTDKDDIQLLSRYEYPNARYSHQAWLSTDGQYLFLDDEQDEDQLGFTSTMHIIDVSDLGSPFEAATFTNGSNAITHNLYVLGDRVFAANYRSGLRVFDVSDPLAPSEEAFFDTWPENDNPTFNGLWSCYPYFNSGTVIGSDREKGLFVWTVEPPLPDPDPDVDGNGLVDGTDVVVVLLSWGPCPPAPSPCPADVNHDGQVDGQDLVAVILSWGS